ncbi:MFS transporter, partial [Streptomyces sioyaensis]|uniref:MFS transporter n=1 Tax=Streptomyces sioyaensis TaxID=67364 RepID=UPI0033E4674F
LRDVDSLEPKREPVSVNRMLSSVVAVIFGFKTGGKEGWGLSPIACLLAGGALAVLFAVRQRRLAQPLVDITLFRSLPFTVAVLANVAGVFAMTGVLFFLPQYIQIVLGLSPLEAGLWSLPLATGAIAGALAAPTMARRLPMGWVIGLGLATAAAGYLVLSLLGVNEAMALTFTAGALLGGGVGVADTLTNDVIIGTAPADKAGAAAGISETAYELGGVMGTAILGSIGASLYSSTVLHNLPASTPSEVSRAASETIGTAHQVASALPAEFVNPFTSIVNRAFVDSMARTFFAAAIIVAAASFGAIFALRKHRSTAPVDH